MDTLENLPIILFKSKQYWHTWLEEHHTQTQGIWLKLAKKHSGKNSVNYDEALEEALCYGWIDAKKQAYNQEYWLQKFTPRDHKSIWSKVNVKKTEMLIQTGKMKPSGIAVVESAKKNGSWQKAYDSPSSSKIPEDFFKKLKKDNKAYTFFKTLNKANLYAIAWRLQTAKKQETRRNRMHMILTMLSKEEKFH